VLARIVYVSRSMIGGWSPELLDIARVAFARNAALEVTGALYFDRLRFCQVLEGEPEALEALMGSIRADSRHFDVQVLIETPLAQRRFGAWSMRFVDGDAAGRLVDAFPEPAAPPGRMAERAERFVDALALH
jgi:hypothetical protein